MAYILDYAQSSDHLVTSHTFGTMPEHATDDLLLWVVGKDNNAGGDLGTPSGWTSLLHQSGEAALRSAVFYKIATSSSESSPTTTTASSGNFHGWMLSIRDADTTTPIHTSTSAAYTSSDSFNSETLTTTNNNCLIIHAIASDGLDQISFTNPGAMYLAAGGAEDGGDSHANTIFWDFQETAGTTDAIACKHTVTEQTNRIAIAINNATGGGIPAYCGDKTTAGTLITPLPSSGAQFNATPTATPSITTVGSKTVTAINGVASSGISTIPSQACLEMQVFTSTGDPSTTAEAGEIGWSSSLDFSSGFFVCSILSNHISGVLSNVGTVNQDSGIINFADTSNNYRAFTIFGRNSDPSPDERMTAVINVNQSSTDYAESGTAPTLTAIDTIQFLVSTYRNNLLTLWISDICKVGTFVVVGGSSALPIDNEQLAIVGKSYRHEIIKRLGDAAFLSYIPLQIGNGSETVYTDIKNTTLQFPEIANKAAKTMNYHAEADDVGISIYGVSGDTIKLTNSTITGASQYYFTIHASATSAATYDFSGLVVVGANVTLRDVTTFDQMTFTDCVAIDASSCDLTSCTITGLTDNNDLTTNASTTFDSCKFNTTALAAGEYMCSVADPSIFTNNTFTGSSSTGHAIRITTAGTYTFTGNTFSGYGADGTTSAAIYNDSGGAVTINIAGGGGTPTYRNGTSATTTINNATGVTITVKDVNTLSAIQNARVLVEADSGGDLPALDSVSITRSGSTASVSHTAHGMANGDSVIIRGATEDEYNGIYTISNVTTNAYDYTVSGTPASPATGSPTATAVIISGLTNASGVAENASFTYTSDQPITGKARKGSASTYYKPSNIVGTITSSGFSTTILLIPDE